MPTTYQRRINPVQRSALAPRLTILGAERKLFFLRHVCLGAATFNLLNSLSGGGADLPALVLRRPLGHRNRPANPEAPTSGRETSPRIRPGQIDSCDGCPRRAMPESQARFFRNYERDRVAQARWSISFGFVGPQVFLTKSGEVGMILELQGVDYECLEFSGMALDARSRNVSSPALRLFDEKLPGLPTALQAETGRRSPHTFSGKPRRGCRDSQPHRLLSRKKSRLPVFALNRIRGAVPGAYRKPVARQYDSGNFRLGQGQALAELRARSGFFTGDDPARRPLNCQCGIRAAAEKLESFSYTGQRLCRDPPYC